MGESADARDGLSGLWLAPAALLNRDQPPRVNGPSTRPTNPVGHQTMDAGRWSGARKRINSGRCRQICVEVRLRAATFKSLPAA
jgi:hypothetical protein